MSGFDFSELIKRAIKYIIEGLAVALVAFLIPRKQMNVEEIVIIALTAAAVFSILDVFIPAAGNSSRVSVGYGAGLGVLGGLPLAA